MDPIIAVIIAVAAFIVGSRSRIYLLQNGREAPH